ncbi:zinc ribbon domain-containing protein [Sediminibacillus massiliensis]|uniref:zinc ribbon domain-containing protein n=1 Tax=Sediminibacillus massiliensis TaxID=1926277 RepID=UPI0015C36D2B|nr:zinc ribbon domain-containing protein [Sediminibacillus massiliensis]
MKNRKEDGNMHCTKCGSMNETEARFCAECGSKLASVQPQEGQQSANLEQAATVEPEASAGGSYKDNEYVQKGKVISRQFFSFAKEALKGPMVASRKVTGADTINGIISHVLFALLLPLFSYFTAKSFSGGYIPIPFGATVIQPFIYLLIYLAVYTAVVYGVAKLMKANTTFLEVMSRFGVFNVLPAAMLLLAVIFSLMSATTFSLLLFGISLVLFVASSLAVIFSVKEDSVAGGIDVYYGLIIANIAMVIIFAIIGDSIVGNLMNDLENGFYGLL